MSDAIIAVTDEAASCLIPNIIAETAALCPCEDKRGLRIEGTAYDGRPVSIRIDAQAGILYIDGMTQEEVDTLKQRRCPLCQRRHQTAAPGI